jgi:outer membrane protein insertion porin family
LAVTAALAALLFLAASIGASVEARAAVRITDITVTGIQTISSAELLDMMGIGQNRYYDEETIRRGILNAFLKGIFSDIKVSSDDTGGALHIEVTERVFVEKISVTGNRAFSDGGIRDMFAVKESMELHADRLESQLRALEADMHLRGYPLASVSSTVRQGANPARAVVELVVSEGKPLLIGKVTYTPSEPDFIYSVGIKAGDVYDRTVITKETDYVRERLRKEGYYAPEVGPHTFDTQSGELKLPVNPGKLLKITFDGNNVFSSRDLAKEMPFLEPQTLPIQDVAAQRINEDSIEEAIMRMLAMYQKKGYIEVQVDYLLKDTAAGVQLEFKIKEGMQYEILSIDVHGNGIDAKKIMEVLDIKEGADYDPDLLKEQREKLVEFYRALGYLRAKVDIEEKLDEKGVHLNINVTSGPNMKISSIEIIGAAHFSREKIISLIDIKEGAPYNEVDVLNARHKILSAYNRDGFTDAAIKIKTRMDDERGLVHLTLALMEGPMYVFGETLVKGNWSIDYRVFKRVFKHQRGEPFNYDLLMDEVREMHKTGLFADINVKVIDRDEAPDGGITEKDVVLEVREGNPGVLEFGVGYGEFEGFRGMFDVRYRNLLGMNREVRLRTEASQISQKHSVTYYEPWFLGRQIPFNATVAYERRDEKNVDTREIIYSVSKYSTTAGVEKPLSEHVKLLFSYDFSLVNTYNVMPDAVLSREDTGTLAISSVIPSLIFDNRDNPFDPRHGILCGVTLKPASYLIMSQTDFVKLSGYFNVYQALTRRFTAALSLRGGISEGLAHTDDLPITERFFLGGRTTVRGYSQDSLGPKGRDGTPTGGDAFLMGNAEIRADVFGSFGLVTFLDAGNVWRKYTDYDTNDIKYTSGLGVRYNTAVGPLRVDYGIKLDRQPGESAGELHFSIGHAF